MGIKITFLAASLLWLLACSKQPEATPDRTVLKTEEYLIKKGNHFSEGNFMQWMDKSEISCQVEFDSSAIYTSVHESNQADVNKLFGFSDCGNTHHQNSARFGWSWSGKGLMLYAYCYINRERVIKPLAIVPLKTPIHCKLSVSNTHYLFTVNDTKDSIPRYCGNYTGSRYKLFPYFGGDEAAPHDIRIKVTEWVAAGTNAKD